MVADGGAARAGAGRLALVDLARGLAIAQMVVYHFIYDLDYFGWIDVAMTRDQPWVGWRTAIVAQFLFLVGLSLTLRDTWKPDRAAFWRRWLQIAAAALLVSLGSWWLFGPRLIWFGILHFVAVALLLGRPLVRLGGWNLVPALLIVAAGLLLRFEPLNAAPWAALGMAARKPATEDYVPLVPWFGVVLAGIAAGAWWRRHDWRTGLAARFDDPVSRALRWAGRWPLSIYLLHQPVLLGLLAGVQRLLG